MIVKKNITSLKFSDALSPLDGRYFLKLQDLASYFSEKTLFYYRLLIEIKYLFFLSEKKLIRKIEEKEKIFFDEVLKNFNEKEFLKIKKIEEKINHDVKVVEYYLKEKLEKTSASDLVAFIHFGLTSEDINNLSYSLMLKNFQEKKLIENLTKLIEKIKEMADKFKDIVFIGRTHGQKAVPTTLGKEFLNYYYRLEKQLRKIEVFKFEGKLNGAVGNFNALKLAFPKENWKKLSAEFITQLNLKPNLYTTQILFYDNYLEFFQMIYLINGILIDFSINIWQYIMLEILVQRKKEKEVGSSTMPQKVNPINFEQTEGALGLANAMFNFFIQKLTHSRLQRDLSDSIIRRFFGEALALTILGWQSFFSGLDKIYPNVDFLKKEMEESYEVLTEAIQIVLRFKKDSEGYEKVKKLVYGKKLQKKDYLEILKVLGLIDNKKLKNLAPEKYL